MIRDKLLIGCFMLLIAFSFIGCGYKEDVKKVDLSRIESPKVVSQDPLKIGLIPEQDIRKMAARYEPLAEYLTKRLDSKVILVYLDSYGEVCDKFIYKQLDGAFFGSFSYVLTHAKVGVEPIARPDYYGTSTYRGLIVVRKDSKIKNVSDMNDKRLSLVHRATYAGYLYPLYYFKEHSIDDLNSYFSKIMFAGSHDGAIFTVLRGEADIATPKDLVYQRVIEENPALTKELVVLSVSEPVPSNTLCVSRDMEPELKNKLKDILLNLDNDPESRYVLEAMGAKRFIETRDEDYSCLYDIIKTLKIDPNSYPYYKRSDLGFGRE